jgi:YfiH family protein
MAKEIVAPFRSGIYSFPKFSPSVLAAFSSREFDASKDLKFFLQAVEIPADRYATVNQVHGSDVVVASDDNKGECGDRDALVTKERGLALVIRTADCIPLFLWDSKRETVGLVHAGWRGARKGIVGRSLEVLGREFGSKPQNIRSAIGPAICEDCYEVGDEFLEYFPGFVRERRGRPHFDLVGWVKKELQEAGVRKGSMIESGICTACSTNRFFSARREGNETGRLLSVLMLK